MNYLDLFSGIGGFSLGLKQAGFKFDKHYFSEVDKYAIEVYQKQFPEAEGLGSVTDIKIRTSMERAVGSNIRPQRNMPNHLLEGDRENGGKCSNNRPGGKDNYKTKIEAGGTLRYCFNGKIDLITFGFPCQDLSIAGKRKGIGGSRSGLFFEATRIINVCKPKYFIFENVKGLFSSDNGECFKACLQEIADIGYDGQWQLLNTRWWLPQNRERIYFVGYPRGECRPKVFPIGESERECNEMDEKQPQITGAINSSMAKGGNRQDSNLNVLVQIGDKLNRDTRILSKKGIIKNKTHASTLCGGGHSGGNYSDMDLIQTAPTINKGGGGVKTGLYQVKAVLTPDRPKKRQNGRRMKENGEPSFTLNDLRKGYSGQNKQSMNKTGMIRRLTPTECERLQGFPDAWTEGLSDTQRYKTLGNAVSVPVVKAVVERLIHKSSKYHNTHRERR